MRILKITCSLIFSIVLCGFFSFRNQAIGLNSTYFYDDFSNTSLNLSKWYPYYNNGYITTYTELIPYTYLRLRANNPSTSYPYIISNDNPIPSIGNFRISLLLRKNNKHFGVGVSFSRKFPLNGTLTKLTESINDYQDEQFINVVLRESDLLIVFCGECYPYCNISNVIHKSINKSLIPTNFIIKIEYVDKKYTIYFNEQIVYSSAVVDYRPNGIWIGSPSTEGSAEWTTLYLDYIKIENITSSPPLIFVPGYMASFDFEDMVNNTSNNQWQKNPVEKVYDNFWNTLKGMGYSDAANGNLQRWDYDFRRPLPEIAAKFKIWLDSYLTTQPPNTKAILVGHSFGGLVARQYLKDNPINNVNRLITVGTPHEGVLDTYPMLAAGISGTNNLTEKLIFETIMQWHGKNYLTKKQVVQNVLPSVQDLIPIFSSGFLKNQVNQNINSVFVNQNLTSLKTAPTPTATINIIRGTNTQTKEFYKLSPRSFLDQILNDWPDGKITSTEYSSQGDNTVLTKSSIINGVTPFEITNANHTDIITEPIGIGKILELAGIACDNCPIVDTPVISPQKAILLLLKSPAEIKVKDLTTNGEIGHGVALPNINGAITAYSNKFIYIPTDDQKRYSIEVVGTGTGEYQFDIIGLDVNLPSSSLTFNKQTSNGKVDTYQVKYEQNGNLVHLTDIEIINPYDSAKKILSEFEQNTLVTDLISDCNLIKRLVENNHDYPNALRQIQKMLVKAFQLRALINSTNNTNKIYLLNKTVDLLKMEKEMFKIVNNQNGQIGLVASQNSASSLNQVLAASESKLANKQNLQDTKVDSFKKAKDFSDEGGKEFQANLAGQSYFTFQISRFLANESLE